MLRKYFDIKEMKSLHSSEFCSVFLGNSASVGWAVNWMAEELGFNSQQEQDIFLFVSRPAMGTTMHILWVSGVLPRVEKTGLEADDSPLSTATGKNVRSFTSTP